MAKLRLQVESATLSRGVDGDNHRYWLRPQQGLAVAKERIERQKNELLFGKDRYIGR